MSRPYKPAVCLDLTWTAPPATATPEGMIFCLVIGQNIPVCKMGESCTVRSCKAREANNGQ